MQLSIFTRLATLHFVFAHTVSAALFINDANQRNTIFPVLDGRNNVPFAERSLSTYSTADVAKHNTKTDPWIIYNNNVYDVTKYINIHPDGPDDITGVAGTDATTAFNEAGHSSDANTTMATYLIGTLGAAAAGGGSSSSALPISNSLPASTPKAPVSSSLLPVSSSLPTSTLAASLPSTPLSTPIAYTTMLSTVTLVIQVIVPISAENIKVSLVSSPLPSVSAVTTSSATSNLKAANLVAVTSLAVVASLAAAGTRAVSIDILPSTSSAEATLESVTSTSGAKRGAESLERHVYRRKRGRKDWM